ncbi:hypothetical protein QM716_11530 [Rhodococcus sp. IEGM 1409]|nr:hypothetical protein [Rhodococcus sp. IEGM 1409]MDI9900485.1 hypothetical protein [Rhodococcus sp. IEGM 1409]
MTVMETSRIRGVRKRIDMEDAADGTDFHTRIKQDGQWKVIAKGFHQYGI